MVGADFCVHDCAQTGKDIDMATRRICQSRKFLATVGLIAAASGCSEDKPATEGSVASSEAAITVLKNVAPTATVKTARGHAIAAFGAKLSAGATASESSDRFRKAHATAFGVAPEDLVSVAPTKTAATVKEEGLGLMYDRKTGKYKYRLFRYQQAKDGIPVHGGELRTLVREGGDNPMVWAHSSTRPFSKAVTGKGAARRAPDAGKALAAVQRAWKELPRRDEAPASLAVQGAAEPMIYAGTDASPSDPVMAVRYQVASRSPESSWTIIADARSGDILRLENNEHLEDLLGTVRGMVTSGARAMDCDAEVSTVLPHAQVTHATLGTFFADESGAFTIANPGTESLTVASPVGGRYFDVTDYSGSSEVLSQTVLPPGPAAFLHNPSNLTDALRAQSNAYAHANGVRDLLLSHVPGYPTISTQENFAVYVNRTDSYCPGNAWYSSSVPQTLNFCVGSTTYGNTAFGSVIYHEFGHHIVQMGGSGQGAYGEGIGDVVSVLMSDDPGLGYGFSLNSCTTPLRNADNNCQYSATTCSSCGSAIHACGQLLSGIVWDIRNALAVTNPNDYREILASLLLNSVPMHTGTTIDASIAVDLLTLDDNDGNLDNGSPHYAQICEGFAAHGLSCPPLSIGLSVSPDTQFAVEGPSGGPFTPESATFQLTNLGPDASVAYQVQPNSAAPWLTIENASGTVAMGQSAQVIVSIDQAAAALLPNGKYEAQLDFVNTTTGVGNESHVVALQVGQPVAVFSEDFSSGLGKFSLDSTSGNYWHVSSSCKDGLTGHSRPGSLFFGSDSTCTFALGDVSGSVTSQAIALADTSTVSLEFSYLLGTENSSYFDAASVLVSVNGGTYQVVASNNLGGFDLSDGTGIWQTASVDLSTLLSGLSSATIRLRFAFDTIDSVANSYAGFWLDDVKVLALPSVCTQDADCSDGLICNGAETCVSGSCVNGIAPSCNDGIACTVDSCSESMGGCNTTADDTLCSDGLACNGVESCNTASGCIAGVPLDCSDGSVCTSDSCSNTLGCQHAPISCSDGNACTTDSCDAVNGCSSVALSCNDSNACTVETCDAALGCQSVALECSDGNACTVDSCNSATGCSHTALSCDDGNPCTTDSCNATTGCSHIAASGGTCSATPCSAYCSNPVTFLGSFFSGNLGTGATCHQTSGTINGGNCGNFANGRQLYVNGQAIACNNGNWPSLPAKVNGGYCVYTTAGDYSWAYFVTW